MRLFIKYGSITIVSILNAAAFNWFYEANHLTCGGITGIAQILHYFIPLLPVGMTGLALNAPLFVLGWRQYGTEFLLSCLYALAVNSVSIDVLNAIITFPTTDPVLAGVYGGVTLGWSLGMLLHLGAPPGGTELGARLLTSVIPHIPVGRICLNIDLAVIVAYAAAFRSLSNALYGGIALFVATCMIDFVVYSDREAKVAYIISEKYELISDQLLIKNIGATIICAQGAYNREDSPVLMCAIRKKNIAYVKEVVSGQDPAAFFIILDAKEVFGKGFSLYRTGEL